MRNTCFNIVILDDHPMIIDGLRLLLSGMEDYVIQHFAHTYEELLSVLTHETDILIFDLNIRGKNIVDRCGDLKSRFPNLLILVFSSYNTPSLVRKALAGGVNGYILKDTTRPELLEALESICKGITYIGKNVYSQDYTATVPGIEPNLITDNFEKISLLTEREMAIVRLIASGKDSHEIADILSISLHTVQSHRKNLLNKLDLHNAADIVRFAFENGLMK